jgi:hypothetical protein
MSEKVANGTFFGKMTFGRCYELHSAGPVDARPQSDVLRGVLDQPKAEPRKILSGLIEQLWMHREDCVVHLGGDCADEVPRSVIPASVDCRARVRPSRLDSAPKANVGHEGHSIRIDRIRRKIARLIILSDAGRLWQLDIGGHRTTRLVDERARQENRSMGPTRFHAASC